ncbi:ABC transporter ATP-binding protein [Microbacterium sp. E-13]|uniref:ABC transporter ATP-binding protein n=1 Tax=Microbacterium sp. E-13 TaxID=3404048 RepID=UPI003CEE4E65
MTLEVKDLDVRYGRRLHVLRGASLSVSRGELVGLLGPNGSGKSTLIKTIAGINAGDAGTLSWDGTVDLGGLPRRELAKLVAYVPQAIQQTHALDVREAVLLGRTPYFGTKPRAEDWRHVDRAISLLGLDELVDRRVTELSGGQAQRVLIARAIAQDPTILLLDEPTSALDIRFQWQTLALARRVAKQNGVASVVAIHDLNQAARFCDRVVFLHEGRVLAAGAPVDVYSSALIEKVYGVEVELSLYKGYVEVHPVAEAEEGTTDAAPQGRSEDLTDGALPDGDIDRALEDELQLSRAELAPAGAPRSGSDDSGWATEERRGERA